MNWLDRDCPLQHDDATCDECGTEHVEVGWAHVCRNCFELDIRDLETMQ